MAEAQLISEIYYLNLELSDLEQELLASARGYPGCYSDITTYIKIEHLLTDLKNAQAHLDMLKNS